MKTLLIAGHPDLSKSVANAAILEELALAFPDMTVRKLCVVAPDGVFHVAAEQAALVEADLIVWQFPFQWYAMPWLMKKWLDEVFVHGFAHGTGGTGPGRSSRAGSCLSRSRPARPKRPTRAVPARSGTSIISSKRSPRPPWSAAWIIRGRCG